MILTFFHRHPRYVIALGVGLLVLFLLGASDHSSLGYPPRLKYEGSGSHGSLESRLEETERDYQAVIARRPELIKKYGGNVKNIEPFPTHGEFYTLWDFWLPAFTCPHKVERIGTLGDGGKYVCGLERLERKQSCVVYSVGVNGESSYEAAILQRAPGCQVYGYDFSVHSFGPEIEEVRALKARSHFWAWGLSGKDTHSSNDPIKMYTLDTLMKMNGHTFIDILKIDIEGAEFDALTDLINHYSSLTPPQPLPFGQLQLEIHARDGWGKDLSKLLKWWERLEEAGLRPFWTEPNLVYMNVYRGGQAPDLAEYSFINIRGEHELLSDAAYLSHQD
ncbi:methyltransferase domain-containing protein [Gautieria morchelliformis]|nr:methyltransferase domain-containing protein [Gautieria morchelliformis]